MDKEIIKASKKETKKTIKELDKGKVVSPEEAAEKTLAVLEKHGLSGVEKFTIKNPITKKETEIELRRDGGTESELILALLDTKNTREQKDFAVSMYLWNRGAESSSLLLDLMQYKGAHTKETRVFKSQMRYDFESVVSMFADHLMSQAVMTMTIMGLDLNALSQGYRQYLETNKGGTYLDFMMREDADKASEQQRLHCAVVSQAIFQYDEGKRMLAARMNIAEAREREKGKGIYVASDGTPYLHDDPALDEAILADREATRNIEQE